ncbi:MAG TPA: transketolase C-terminal domain-containing protein [Patescibacteria group bacterium]|nr:transketolase C-terminal domain-containing protein [Patescibacteria group bacterium]
MLNPNLNLNQNLFDKEKIELKSVRDGFGDGLMELGKTNPDVVVLTADLSESTRVEKFAKEYPQRFFECGVAEQNMAAIAAGLGVSGKIAFISSYAVFSPGKNWETIRTTTVYNQANVKIAGHHTGIATGADGVTHQASEDIAITRCWPGIQIFSPCDAVEAQKATIASVQINTPVYLRFSRQKSPIITTEQTPFTSGQIVDFWQTENPQVTIFATGYLLYQALLAAKELEEENIPTIVANVATIKPLDGENILKLTQISQAVVTVEDHQIMGGMGGAIAEFLAQNKPLPMEFIGLQNTFAQSGSPEDLMKKYGLDKDAIKSAVKKVIERKIK